MDVALALDIGGTKIAAGSSMPTALVRSTPAADAG
jgi:hypothetical protein